MHVGTNPQKVKFDLKFNGWAWSKNGCGQSGHGTLTLTVFQESTDGVNWFLYAYTDSGKL